MPYRTFQGSLDATNLRIGVIVSRFNEFITEALAAGALEVLEKHGCLHENISFVKVPGAGHSSTVERPEPVTEAIERFLQKVYPA